MNKHFHPDQGVLMLSRETVDAWLDEQRQLESEMSLLTHKMNTVQVKLDAARVLAPSLFRSDVPAEQRTVIERIVDVLTDSDEPLSPKEVRDRLADDERVAQSSNNYLYTAMSRAVDRGKVVRVGEKYTVPQPHLGLGNDGA